MSETSRGAVPPLPRSLACMGNSQDIGTWSNIPYFFFQAAVRRGFLTHALNLDVPTYKCKRIWWNLLAPFRLESPGGYQYSRAAADLLWQRVPEELRRGEIICHFQLFPPLDLARAAGVQHSFYCDATMRLLLDVEGQPWNTAPTRRGQRTMADALKREGELYRSARFFIGMAKATAQSAIRDYGVDPAKVFVVRPGANLDEAVVQAYLAQRGRAWRLDRQPFTPQRPARLGFIGKDYVRKGLLRLLAAAELLHQRGRPVRISLIGHCPESLRAHPLVEWVGFISKATAMRQFVAAVDRFALGCLPSYAEPLGISTLEALRLGVPVMGTNTGGIPDCIPSDGGFLLPADATDEAIAEAIEQNLFNVERYHRLCEGAEQEMPHVTWDSTVQRMMEIWDGKSAAAHQ